MTLASTGSSFAYRATSFTITNGGTAVAPGASNAQGAWTQLLAAAAFEADGVAVGISGGNTSAVSKMHLLDIGVDPAGGTSYAPIVADMACGMSSATASGGSQWWFPLRIPAGASIAARIRGSAATAGTCLVRVELRGRASRPEQRRVGAYSATLGAQTASSLGTAFVPDANAAKGAWALLGTTSRPLWWWQIGVQCDNSNMSTRVFHIDLAHGDASNKTLILSDVLVSGNSAEVLTVHGMHKMMDAYCEVPAGVAVYVRGACNNTPEAGWNATATGIGG